MKTTKNAYIPVTQMGNTHGDGLGHLYARVLIELDRIDRGVSHENPQTIRKLHKHLRKILFS